MTSTKIKEFFNRLLGRHSHKKPQTVPDPQSGTRPQSNSNSPPADGSQPTTGPPSSAGPQPPAEPQLVAGPQLTSNSHGTAESQPTAQPQPIAGSQPTGNPQRTSSPIPDDLWDAAYIALATKSKKTQELVENYEILLSRYAEEAGTTSIPVIGASDREQQLAELVKKKSDEVQKNRLRIALGGKEFVIQEQVNKVVQRIIYAKDFIGQAVSAEPHAALAWAGVSLLLPLFLNPYQQETEAVEGLERISDLVLIYRVYEQTFLRPDTDDNGESSGKEFMELKGSVAGGALQLYSLILEFQIRLAFQYSRPSLLRGLRNLVSADSWKDLRIQIEAIHSTMDEKTRNLNYKKTSDDFAHQKKQLALILKNLDWVTQDKKKIDCHNVFSNYVDYKLAKDRIYDRLEGTCQWFLANEKYHWWRCPPETHEKFKKEKDGSKLLFVTADPGCGKSVLLKWLIDVELAPTKDRLTCYFFFDECKWNVTEALCTLLHQLFIQEPDLLQLAIPEFDLHGTKLASQFTKLWDILESCAKKYSGEVVCILDALDECATGREEGQLNQLNVYRSDAHRNDLITKLNKYYTEGDNKKGTLKFLISGRPYSDKEFLFDELTKNLPNSRLAGEQLSMGSDIDAVIDARVKTLTLEDPMKEFLSQKLKAYQTETRTFLWLDLVFHELQTPRFKGAEEPTLKKFLDREIPSSVDDAYDNILKRSSKDEPELAKTLLHIVVGARRPFELKEMNIALELSQLPKTKTFQSYKELGLQSPDYFEERVKNLCGLFVTVINQNIYFLHPTARTFLLPKMGQNFDTLIGTTSAPWAPEERPKEKWRHAFSEFDSHTILAEICVKFLVSGPIRQKPLEIDYSSSTEDLMRAIDNYLAEYPFLEYAAGSWQFHALTALGWKGNNDMRENMKDICDVDHALFRTWFLCFWRVMTEGQRTIRETFNLWFCILTTEKVWISEEVQAAMSEEWRSGVRSTPRAWDWHASQGTLKLQKLISMGEGSE